MQTVHAKGLQQFTMPVTNKNLTNIWEFIKFLRFYAKHSNTTLPNTHVYIYKGAPGYLTLFFTIKGVAYLKNQKTAKV